MWNQLAEKYKDKPIIFLAVNSGNTESIVERYRQSTEFTYPILVDEHRKTEAAYGFEVSLRNVMVWRIIDANGIIVGYSPQDATLEKALKDASFWLMGKRAFSAQALPAARALEWGRYEEANKALALLRRARGKDVKDDCQFLLDALNEKARAESEKAKDLAADGKKYDAYRLYESIATRFAVSDSAKDAMREMRTLARDSTVRKEIMARKNYERAIALMASTKPNDRQMGRMLLLQIERKFAGTEAAASATEMLKKK